MEEHIRAIPNVLKKTFSYRVTIWPIITVNIILPWVGFVKLVYKLRRMFPEAFVSSKQRIHKPKPRKQFSIRETGLIMEGRRASQVVYT